MSVARVVRSALRQLATLSSGTGQRGVLSGAVDGGGYSGASAARVGGRTVRPRSVGLIGLPFSRGQGKQGVEEGPSAIRQHGLAGNLRNLGWQLTDYGDVAFERVPSDRASAGIKYPRTTGKAMKQISEAVKSVVEANGLAVTLGGDHSVAIGSIHGHSQVNPNLCVIWVDAHTDINTPCTTTSGNVHGMPLAFLLRELEEEVAPVRAEFPEWAWLEPCLSAKNVAYIGLRDVEPKEAELVKKLGISAYSMYEIDKYGIAECVRRALHAVNPNLDRPIHMSYDIDALDPAYASSTGTPVTGGLTMREAFFIAEEIAATDRLCVADLVEVNPRLGDEKTKENTVVAATKIIGSLLGERIL